ncbi:cadherin repeat domain-containing protein [Flagellimonas zhangzhouensis]|uniref:Cadherin domain-containing protein n=1 Tax=Flagellimonas zhangzhouensis TaxID=1073328 RepID=A0A1H2RZI8_9FLAO|nr:cadherin repeat domain-containing protein [Allomuricauda zhangzhouensis]SDQ69132.1 hypothetical protein SAMN05216294_2215 [Allomuricauda zhangzhouensis]SDW24861.1 hypothetical protein SAMN04487892_0862 [Allomuricauda zhangzhouensis]
MKKNLFLSAVLMATIWSCSKEDEPATTKKLENLAPNIEAQSFVVKENIDDTYPIGAVEAHDEDVEDFLIFKIVDDSDALFEITEISGTITLREGKNLDFNNATSHTITVEVNDGYDKASSVITINVSNSNVAPVFDEAYLSFETKKDIAESEEIGTLKVIDEDEDPISYVILKNTDDNLFKISEKGVISLAEGKSFNDEIEQYTILIGVHDGLAGEKAEVTITVVE